MGPSGKRGLLTHCLLQALEEMNFQGSFYALWWHAIRVLRQTGISGQHFQLIFSDGTDPTCREVFEPVTQSEAQAYAKRAELERVIEDGSHTHRHFSERCCTAQVSDLDGLGSESLLSARGAVSCGCGGPEA